MERVGFTMRLLPGQEAEYRRRHAAVWPEMLDELKAAGAANYSTFLDGDRLFGYLEVEDLGLFQHSAAAWPSRFASYTKPKWKLSNNALNGRSNTVVTIRMIRAAGWRPWDGAGC